MLRLLTLAAALAAGPALAEDTVTHAYGGSFEDATFSVENAIINRGLVIDFVSHVGDMLNRTGGDVGSEVRLFDAADIFVFCSAEVSRQVMEADPGLIAQCPYGIFVTDREGQVEIGHKLYADDSPMQMVEDMLAAIVEEALEQ